MYCHVCYLLLVPHEQNSFATDRRLYNTSVYIHKMPRHFLVQSEKLIRPSFTAFCLKEMIAFGMGRQLEAPVPFREIVSPWSAFRVGRRQLGKTSLNAPMQALVGEWYELSFHCVALSFCKFPWQRSDWPKGWKCRVLMNIYQVFHTGGDNGSIGFGSVLVRDFLMTHWQWNLIMARSDQ